MRFFGVFLGVALVFLATSTEPAAAARKGPINITATLLSATMRHLGPSGKLSDASEQKWRLNDRNGRPVGRLLLGCRWIVPRARLCNGTIRMPLGVITIAGDSPTGLDGQYAVTGGTGIYESVGGSLTFISIGSRKMIVSVVLT